jgi:hypothetical protein
MKTHIMCLTCSVGACLVLQLLGANTWGQAGIGSNDTLVPPPGGIVNLGTGRKAVQISVGQWHTCALLDHGAVKCWVS